MESQPQNPEFRINPEKVHPCTYMQVTVDNVNFCDGPRMHMHKNMH